MLKKIAAFAFLVLAFGVQAAGDDRQCSVTFTAGAAGSTASPSSGTCNWQVGSTLLMQCDQDVYFNTTTSTAGVVGPATNVDFQVNFSANRDPYVIYMFGSGTGGGNRHVSVLGVSASGTCKFAASPRRKPI